jgi:hypothetical protein
LKTRKKLKAGESIRHQGRGREEEEQLEHLSDPEDDLDNSNDAIIIAQDLVPHSEGGRVL